MSPSQVTVHILIRYISLVKRNEMNRNGEDKKFLFFLLWRRKKENRRDRVHFFANFVKKYPLNFFFSFLPKNKMAIFFLHRNISFPRFGKTITLIKLGIKGRPLMLLLLLLLFWFSEDQKTCFLIYLSLSFLSTRWRKSALCIIISPSLFSSHFSFLWDKMSVKFFQSFLYFI